MLYHAVYQIIISTLYSSIVFVLLRSRSSDGENEAPAESADTNEAVKASSEPEETKPTQEVSSNGEKEESVCKVNVTIYQCITIFAKEIAGITIVEYATLNLVS